MAGEHQGTSAPRCAHCGHPLGDINAACPVCLPNFVASPHPPPEPSEADKKTARQISHQLAVRCTGGTDYGPGGDVPRWHSERCDEGTEAISTALAQARQEGARDENEMIARMGEKRAKRNGWDDGPIAAEFSSFVAAIRARQGGGDG